MTTLFQILSGKEEDLLSYFKEKYNLVEREVKEIATMIEKSEKANEISDPHAVPNAFQNKPATDTNKVSKGIGNLFGGTSWGKN
jgi:hypothetical protein